MKFKILNLHLNCGDSINVGGTLYELDKDLCLDVSDEAHAERLRQIPSYEELKEEKPKAEPKKEAPAKQPEAKKDAPNEEAPKEEPKKEEPKPAKKKLFGRKKD